jgi:hypothetical protein
VAIPQTFSAPGDAYEPSVEDCLRDGVWLMLLADDLIRKSHSFDPENAVAGVRILAGAGNVEPGMNRLTVPQIIVNVGIGSNRFELGTTGDAEKTITIVILMLEKPDTSYLRPDVDAPPLTAETKLARLEEVLMRGTLYRLDEDENLIVDERGRVIDPYYSPLEEDGTYTPASVVFLNTGPPSITRQRPFGVRRKPPDTEDDLFRVDPQKDIAVAYGVFATYTVTLNDRKNLRRGGANAAE